MKHLHPVALAAVALLASTAAQAQSSVTVSGIADAAVRVVSNEDRSSVKSLVSGSNSTSRLIFRGTEDLGSGLSAGFHLEHGIRLDSGEAVQSTQFWDRRSTVSLASRTLGELRAGRDFVPSYVAWSRHDPFSYVGVGGSTNLISATPNGPIRNTFGTAANTVVRASNAVQWIAPAGLGGFEGGLLVAAGEGGTAASGQAKVTGLRAGWAGSGFNLGAAHTRSENDRTDAGGVFKDSTVGGGWDAGVVRLSLAWRRFDQADAKQTNWLLGAWVPVGAGEIKLSYLKADFDGRVGRTNLGANGSRQLAAGYVHALSKRTALYATVARLDNDGAHALAIPGGAAGLAAGNSSTGTEFGLRHNF